MTQRPAVDPRYRRLPPGAARVWQLENLVGAVAGAGVLLGLVAAPFVPSSWHVWLFRLLWLTLALTIVEALVVIPARYRTYRYAVLEDHIGVTQGRWLFKRYVFPLHQILYVESQQGPLLRHFGLVKVQLGTIGESHALGPVPEADADELRRAVKPLGDAR